MDSDADGVAQHRPQERSSHHGPDPLNALFLSHVPTIEHGCLVTNPSVCSDFCDIDQVCYHTHRRDPFRHARLTVILHPPRSSDADSQIIFHSHDRVTARPFERNYGLQAFQSTRVVLPYTVQ